jgi:hypothetical protein
MTPSGTMAHFPMLTDRPPMLTDRPSLGAH